MNRVKWDEITAIFGGAFDPPHLGHREAVEHLLRNPGVRNVLIVPAGNPPLKTTTTPAEHRLEMVKLNFHRLREGLSLRVDIDDRELRRNPVLPSYTFNTVQELRQDLGRPLAFVIGADQVESLDRWHRVRELLGLCHWIAIERHEQTENESPDPSIRMANALRRLSALGLLRSTSNPREWETPGGMTLLSVPTDARASSSTEIRRQFARGLSVSPHIIGQIGSESLPGPTTENLHPDVESYLKAHHLYGT